MELFTSTALLQERLKNLSAPPVLIPTMGALHEGHLSLIKLAKMRGKPAVATVFVNPTQFNDPRDFEKYPRTVEADAALLEGVGTDFLFAPGSSEEIYHSGFQSWLEVSELSRLWEGASRPGHFRGVATIVTILFSMIRPQAAVFGEKDFQQLRIIETLVRDLRLGVEIIRGPIIREEGGLAMSSRNTRLSPEGRQAALCLSRGLKVARDAFKGGERRAPLLKGLVMEMINAEPKAALDYVAVVDETSLIEIKDQIGDVPPRILVAATVEGVRLIDNMELQR